MINYYTRILIHISLLTSLLTWINSWLWCVYFKTNWVFVRVPPTTNAVLIYLCLSKSILTYFEQWQMEFTIFYYYRYINFYFERIEFLTLGELNRYIWYLTRGKFLLIMYVWSHISFYSCDLFKASRKIISGSYKFQLQTTIQ